MRERTSEVYENGFTDHVLVCTNARDSKYAACAEAHGDEVLETVKSWLRDRGVFWSRVHVAETSCLGLCSADGAAVAPDGGTTGCGARSHSVGDADADREEVSE